MTRCAKYRPDHNGECLDCDEPADAHPGESWSAFYTAARWEMAFRYGRRGIPKDRYREQWELGATPQQAARAITEKD